MVSHLHPVMWSVITFTSHDVINDLYTQLYLRSAWVSALSDQSSLFARRFIATHIAHSGDWSESAIVQADPSLGWAHYFVGFVVLWLKLLKYKL